MANSKQAAKRARQNDAKRAENGSVRSDFRTEAKKFLRLVKDGKHAEAAAQVRTVESKVDKAAKRNVIRTGQANRIKSRLKGKLSASGKAPVTAHA
jgi:small subunit ribosomal protein S20